MRTYFKCVWISPKTYRMIDPPDADIVIFNGFKLFSGLALDDFVSWTFVFREFFNGGEVIIFSVGVGVGLNLTWFVVGGEFLGDSLTPLVSGGDLTDLGDILIVLGEGFVAGEGECLGEILWWWLLRSALWAILIPRVWHTVLDSLSIFSGSWPTLMVSTPTFWGSICNSKTSCCNSQVADGDN